MNTNLTPALFEARLKELGARIEGEAALAPEGAIWASTMSPEFPLPASEDSESLNESLYYVEMGYLPAKPPALVLTVRSLEITSEEFEPRERVVRFTDGSRAYVDAGVSFPVLTDSLMFNFPLVCWFDTLDVEAPYLPTLLQASRLHKTQTLPAFRPSYSQTLFTTEGVKNLADITEEWLSSVREELSNRRSN